jgi:hypothetical protein
MWTIDSIYLVQLDGLVFDLQVGRDVDGSPLLVLGELVELTASPDGTLTSFGSTASSDSLIGAADVAELEDDAVEAALERRLRLSILAGSLLGLPVADAIAALAA